MHTIRQDIRFGVSDGAAEPARLLYGASATDPSSFGVNTLLRAGIAGVLAAGPARDES